MFQSSRRRTTLHRLDSRITRLTEIESGPSWTTLGVRWLPRLVITLAAVSATVIVLSADNSFRYRLGQRVSQELRLRTEIEVFDAVKTRQIAEEAESLSRLVFMQDPQPNTELRDKIATLASALVDPTESEKLSVLLKTEWPLPPETIQKLKAAIGGPAGLASFRRSLNTLFVPILQRGLLDEKSLPPDEQRSIQSIDVYRPGSDRPDYSPRIEEVALGTFTAVDGPLRSELEKLFPKEHAETLYALLVPRLKPSLLFDRGQTEANKRRERGKARPQYDNYKKGFLIAEQGQVIDTRVLTLLQAEHEKLLRETQATDWLQPMVGRGAIVFAVLVGLATFLGTVAADEFAKPRQVIKLAAIVVLSLLGARLLAIEPYFAEVIALSYGAMLISIAFGRAVAMTVAMALALLVAMMDAYPIDQFVVLLIGTGVGVLTLDRVRTRTKLIKVGVWCGLAYAVSNAIVGLANNQPWQLFMADALRDGACGLIAGFLLSGTLPFAESWLGIVTDISLIELSDTSHPLLRELIRRAPGTYNHSVTISMIGEAAAKRIGANALQVRVGALFHDIGKMLKPQYFIENQVPGEQNRHSQLAPALSTLIIIGHVKDGVDLAQQHNLPKPILELIEQHHGTTLVDYFFHEAARELNRQGEPDESVEEHAFRYPGPRPQSKEAAILMLCDCVESASRTLREPTPARIEKLVHNLSLTRLLDGQFNESGLTLAELELIEESLTQSLNSVYHGRIKYPAAS